MEHSLTEPAPLHDPVPGARRPGTAHARPTATAELVVDVRSDTLRDALRFAADHAGWRCRSSIGPATVLVTDTAAVRRPEVPARRRVLVCAATPIGARDGLRALAQGRVGALLCDDRPADLRRGLVALADGWLGAPARVLDLAASAPDVTSRQLDVLAAVVAGRTNTQIARDLYLSRATVKRELTHLFRLLGDDNRVALAARCVALGVTARHPPP